MKMFNTKFGSLVFLLLGTSLSYSQICGTDYFLEKEYQNNPGFQNVVEQNWMLSDGPIASTKSSESTVKIIPVVFHVFHDNGAGNISYEQIQSAIDMLNEDFRRTNSDTNNTRNIFKPFAADSEIEFRLATIDPYGNCTNGVVRINHPTATNNADNSIKLLSYWPSNKYFNIWVVQSIESSGVPGTILGYAQFPGSGSWTTYGVVIRGDRVGRVGTALYGDRTLTHELGHCLNLLHTFQSGCGSTCDNTGDRVCDTPPVNNSTQSCNWSQNQCVNDMIGNSPFTSDVVDQIENYMSYNDCQNMFTYGQKSRMINALTNFPALIQLTSTSNLNATGALLPAEGVCQASFEVKSQTVCVGEPVQFFDQSFFNPASYTWEFEGGIPNTSNDTNPIVVYHAPGKYAVKLTIFDTNNSSVSSSIPEYITVISSEGKTTPITESFETTAALQDIGWVNETNSNGLSWKKSNTGGATGTHALQAEVFGKSGVARIAGPAFDISNMTKVTVSFKYAFAPRTGSNPSLLRAYISTDCGTTWKSSWIIGGAVMTTAPERNTPYTHPQPGDWVNKSFSVSLAQASSLRIKFEITNQGNNNVFIDDINIWGSYSPVVILNTPKNGSNGLSSNVLLDWKGTSKVDYYKIEIDTTPDFNSPLLITQQKPYTSSSSTGPDSQHQTQGLDNGLWYWRVRGERADTTYAWSETWNFSVDVNGIERIHNNGLSFSIFPNPAKDHASIQIITKKTENIEIHIYSLTGVLVKTVYSGKISGGSQNFEINCKQWETGLYLVRITSETSTHTSSLIINK